MEGERRGGEKEGRGGGKEEREGKRKGGEGERKRGKGKGREGRGEAGRGGERSRTLSIRWVVREKGDALNANRGASVAVLPLNQRSIVRITIQVFNIRQTHW